MRSNSIQLGSCGHSLLNPKKCRSQGCLPKAKKLIDPYADLGCLAYARNL